jgi:hypothetical protein
MDDVSRSVAVVKWAERDGISEAIEVELSALGYQPKAFLYDASIPDDAEVVFSFAPYGPWLQIPMQAAARSPDVRPLILHWNTENPPDLRLPWPVVYGLGMLRSWLGRVAEDKRHRAHDLCRRPPLSWIASRMTKFRYVGDYHFAYRQGWLDLLVESSAIYAALHRKHGLPALCVPWGSVPSWSEEMDLERDVDVLWLGKRRTRRRSQLLDRVRRELASAGVSMYVADGVENPFVYGHERTRLLNRSAITLNLLPVWYDHAFPYRFHVAAPNRSLVVSEPTLRHSSQYVPGRHYVEADVDAIATTIRYYLEHEQERLRIVENAYCLATQQLTFGRSVKAIMAVVESVLR